MSLLNKIGFGGFRRSASPSMSGAAKVPADWRVYAIGDVHGRADLLDALSTFIAAELKSSAAKVNVTVFLGDYVDRGPESAKVIGRLSAGDWPTPLVCLMGNHEDALLRFLEDETIFDRWRHWGGIETLMSYGVDCRRAKTSSDYKSLQTEFREKLPTSHVRFLTDLQTSITIGDYFFCHAGVAPGVPLDEQRREDLIMIREPFLSSRADHGKVVVHGHTPAEAAVVGHNRIGIDTGAYATGRLTALALEGENRRLLTASI